MHGQTVIVGVGSLAVALANEINQSASLRCALLVDTGPGTVSLQQFAEQHGCAYRHCATLKDAELLQQIAEFKPKYIFSADNQRIFGAKLLRLADTACINFHNGPLPEYRGVNIPSWVIWNQEPTHAVTWHVMVEELDAGAILLQRKLDVAPRETAFSLSLKCIQAGIDSTQELLARLEQQTAIPSAQLVVGGQYYSRADVPNDGILDARWNCAELDRLFRALNYKTITNHVGVPKVLIDGQLRELKSCKWFPHANELSPPRAKQIVLEKPDGWIVLGFRT